ncbi:MAG: hypothetical protein A2162_05920 [Deltaproteobacteria bacterium RBG_13_52_11b]|nr:MAG: hypothetical protein A2162_05920 [Deltaproteobacteria bacterium RBG_13_52_11b]
MKKKISKPGGGIGKALQRSLFSFGYMRLQAYRESTKSEVLWDPSFSKNPQLQGLGNTPARVR